jgi:hypothetical protein
MLKDVEVFSGERGFGDRLGLSFGFMLVGVVMGYVRGNIMVR